MKTPALATSFLVFAVLLSGCVHSPATDADISGALADIDVPVGVERPTVAGYPSTRVFQRDGTYRQATLDEFRQSYLWNLLPMQLAQKYYPEVLTNISAPEDLVLAFVVKDTETVLLHTKPVVHTKPGGSLESHLQKLFPETQFPERFSNGAQCFPELAGKHPRFCVYYGVLESL